LKDLWPEFAGHKQPAAGSVVGNPIKAGCRGSEDSCRMSGFELKDGRVIKLDTPKYLYEAYLLNGNKVGEIVHA
jgi:hypothetical protein